MQTLKLRRSDLPQLFGEQIRHKSFRNAARLGLPEYSPESQSLWVSWPEKSEQIDDMPRLIIVADEDLTDFLAWAVTFLQPIRPLTAFIRIIPWSVYDMVRDMQSQPNKEIAPVLAGAILGEAMIHTAGRGYFEMLPLTAFDSTMSASVGRALLRGFGPELITHTVRNWRLARQITDQPTRLAIPESLEKIWTVILRLSGQRNPNKSISPQLETIYEGCREIRSTGTMSSPTWNQITQGRLNNSRYVDAMSESKERRVKVFEEAAKELVQNSPDELYSSFLIGYLASLVSGGSLEHANLVLPLQEQLPMVMPWYGICSSLIPGNRVLSDYNHLGLRLVRTMGSREDLLSQPSCDIAVNELEVLHRGDSKASAFRQMNSSILRIEIAPTVTSVVKWPLATNIQAGKQMNLFANEEFQQAKIDSNRLKELINSLRKSIYIAEEFIGDDKDKNKNIKSKNTTKRVPRIQK